MKNNSILFSIIFLAAILLLLNSCKKDNEKEEETHTHPLSANINILSPTAGLTVDLGMSVALSATINAGFDMHGYEAYLINVTADDTVWSVDAHDHGTAFTITGEWINSVTAHSDMRFKVIANLDHDGNTSSKEVEFHCHPM